MVRHDLKVVSTPYVIIACIVLVVLLIFVVSKMPDTGKEHEESNWRPCSSTCCSISTMWAAWSPDFLCRCADHVLDVHHPLRHDLIGLSASEAQNYNIVAMSIFLCSRFICTFLLKYLNPGSCWGSWPSAGWDLRWEQSSSRHGRTLSA